MSCPQTLYPTLRSAQEAFDVAAVGVGADLRLKILLASPTRVLASVPLIPKTRLRVENATSACCLAPCWRERSVTKETPALLAKASPNFSLRYARSPNSLLVRPSPNCA